MFHILSNGGVLVITKDRNPENICKLIEKFNDFKSIRKLSINKVEFELNNGSLIKFQY